MDLAFVIKLQQIIQDLNKSTNFFEVLEDVYERK